MRLIFVLLFITSCVAETLYPDEDHDGFPLGQDCNDHNPAVHPGAPELCNDVDDNCNGITDTDRWPKMHQCCAAETPSETYMGTWECDLDHIGIMCAPNFEEWIPAACLE